MLTAAFLLAFFGVLRVSDFTIPSWSRFNPRTQPTKDSVACKRKYLPSQSKHQKQTSYTRVIRFTYSAPMSNFAQSQPCKSTFIIFLATLQSERSRCSHLEIAALSPGTAAFARLVTHPETSTRTVSVLVLLRQQRTLACLRTRSKSW